MLSVFGQDATSMVLKIFLSENGERKTDNNVRE